MVATWAFRAQIDVDGGEQLRYSGLRYLSRCGQHECWAIFDGSRVREISRDTISLDDADLRTVANDFGPRLF